MTNSDAQPPPSPSPEELALPHDALFFWTFSHIERAAAELKDILPEKLVATIDWSTLTLSSGRFVDPKLTNRYTDILYSVMMAGQPTYVHVLFEHESEGKPWSLLQALRYHVRIWDEESQKPIGKDGKRLTPIVTVILHHGESGFTSSKQFGDYFKLEDAWKELLSGYLLDFRVIVDDIGKVDTEALLERSLPAQIVLVLFVLRFSRMPSRFMSELPKMMSVIRAVHHEPDGDRCIGTAFMYVERVAKIPASELRMALQEALGTNEALIEDILFPERRFERLKQETDRIKQESDRIKREAERDKRVIQELERAKREAERLTAETERRLLLRQLEQRFGALPEEARSRIAAASSSDVDAMVLRVLTANTLDEVLDEPRTKQTT